MRPKFSQLTPAEQQNFGNGVGPDWIPKWAREVATAWLCFFFASASWRHHDFGYEVGGERWDRRRCDDKFLIAMRHDALSLPALQFWAIPLALMIAYSTSAEISSAQPLPTVQRSLVCLFGIHPTRTCARYFFFPERRPRF